MSSASFSIVNNTLLNGPSVLKKALANQAGRCQVHGAAGVLTASEWQAALQGRLIVTNNAANDLQVGADSAANAKNLQVALGIPNQNDQCLLRILPASNTNTVSDIDLAITPTGTNNNVHISLAGSDSGTGTQILFNTGAATTGVGAGSEAIVQVTNVVDTAGSEEIRFTILQQSSFNA